MDGAQPGILAPVPSAARYLFFTQRSEEAPGASLRRLCDLVNSHRTVVGMGQSLLLSMGRTIPGIAAFPRYALAGIEVPSTPEACWCWLRGEDRGELVHRSRAIEKVLHPALQLSRAIDGFQFGSGRDMSGYEDGTENPVGEKAIDTAIVSGKGAGLDGSSFVAVQLWVHDLDAFEAMSPEEQDMAIGRRKKTNEEIPDAPPSAHVKRTAQESFQPQAFILRRSMPWSDEKRAGLVFVAFGRSFDAFEAQLRRMVGAEDGISDALFRFTRPVSGGYFWCPPVRDGHLDLRALGI